LLSYSLSFSQNPHLWARYQGEKELIRQQCNETEIEEVILREQPVLLDKSINECFLFTGTGIKVIDAIAEGGFKQAMSRNPDQLAFVSFLSLSFFLKANAQGHGNYLTDTSAKALNYARCSECDRNDCSHGERKAVIVARATLGKAYISTEKLRGHATPPNSSNSTVVYDRFTEHEKRTGQYYSGTL